MKRNEREEEGRIPIIGINSWGERKETEEGDTTMGESFRILSLKLNWNIRWMDGKKNDDSIHYWLTDSIPVIQVLFCLRFFHWYKRETERTMTSLLRSKNRERERKRQRGRESGRMCVREEEDLKNSTLSFPSQPESSFPLFLFFFFWHKLPPTQKLSLT